MYLNIILTLIFINLGLIAWASLSGKKYQIDEHEKAKQYNKEVNDEVLELHWLLLNEMKSMTEKQKEILAEIKRKRHDRLML